MKPTTCIKNLATGISLLVLAVGFSLLGYLSFISTYNNSLAASRSLECGVSLAGSVASFGIGVVFLVAALLYRRYCTMNRAAGSPHLI